MTVEGRGPDAVLPGESSLSLTAFAAPLARLPMDGDALREGAGNSGHDYPL